MPTVIDGLKARLPDPVRNEIRRRRYHANYVVRRMEIALGSARSAVAPSRTVLFFPDLPHPDTIAYKFCAALGYRITSDPTRASDLAIRWERSTFSDPAADRILAEIAKSSTVINARCTDISKERVNEAFAHAFGYDLGVDPRVHVGPCVEKSDLNAQHDGRIVTAPVAEPAPGRVYQRLVDNRVGEALDSVMDIRIPVFRGYIPLAYLRFRPVDRRFRSGNREVRIARVYDVLDEREIADLLRMCSLLGVDYGELDVLRDVGDGRVYVVDVNNTPYGPPSGISDEDGRRAVLLLTAAFESEIATSRRENGSDALPAPAVAGQARPA